jgi:hypothetical protein
LTRSRPFTLLVQIEPSRPTKIRVRFDDEADRDRALDLVPEAARLALPLMRLVQSMAARRKPAA